MDASCNYRPGAGPPCSCLSSSWQPPRDMKTGGKQARQNDSMLDGSLCTYTRIDRNSSSARRVVVCGPTLLFYFEISVLYDLPSGFLVRAALRV